MNKSILRTNNNSLLKQSKNNKGIALITLTIIIIAILLVAGLTIFLVSTNINSTKKDETIASRENEIVKDNSNNSKKESENNQDKYVIYINNYKIILGKRVDPKSFREVVCL